MTENIDDVHNKHSDLVNEFKQEINQSGYESTVREYFKRFNDYSASEQQALITSLDGPEWVDYFAQDMKPKRLSPAVVTMCTSFYEESIWGKSIKNGNDELATFFENHADIKRCTLLLHKLEQHRITGNGANNAFDQYFTKKAPYITEPDPVIDSEWAEFLLNTDCSMRSDVLFCLRQYTDDPFLEKAAEFLVKSAIDDRHYNDLIDAAKEGPDAARYALLACIEKGCVTYIERLTDQFNIELTIDNLGRFQNKFDDPIADNHIASWTALLKAGFEPDERVYRRLLLEDDTRPELLVRTLNHCPESFPVSLEQKAYDCLKQACMIGKLNNGIKSRLTAQAV